MSQNVLVVAEKFADRLQDVTFELIGKGRELAAALGGSLEVALLGGAGGELTGQLGAADVVLAVDHPALAQFNPETYLKTLTEVVKARAPQLVLVPYTSMGMDLAAGLSAALNFPLLTYAVDLSIRDQKLVATCQLYGGKMNIEASAETLPAVVAVIAGSFPADAGRAGTAPKVETLPAPSGLENPRIRFKRLIEPQGGDVDITQQDILVSVGRGIQSEENIPLAQELADALGGALASSRPIVDNKWMPKTRQVGKSGVKVKPKLYLALGISGAPEHIEGMKDAELIIAVNTDPNAPIFDYAHYGITADLFDIVPALTAQLKS